MACLSQIEPIEQIKQCIDKKQNFLLSGGAGSGKTYTLGETLKYIYSTRLDINVACITYTNVAAQEIVTRFPNYHHLRVSTIHDFLWTHIKQYQCNIKKILIQLLNSEEIKYTGETKITLELLKNKQIQYKEYRKFEEGIISHDEVLHISFQMFKQYPLLCKIIKDRYPYILIDEYQDTDKKVIPIFLDFLHNEPFSQNVIGLFGDSMQAIYDSGIGNIDSYIANGVVTKILKQDNYRCSSQVINLINKIRHDDIQQVPAKKDKNGKIVNETGSIKFIYSQYFDIDKIKSSHCKSWNFTSSSTTKELYLTKKLIAAQVGFKDLIDKYPNSDRLLGNNKDILITHLYKIADVLSLYQNKQFHELFKYIPSITTPQQKTILQKALDTLVKYRDKSIEDIIGEADNLNLVKIDDRLIQFKKEKSEIYDAIKDLSFLQILALQRYELDKTIFSTQHGVKGTEFKDVLIILDNGKWIKYNFKYLFENSGNESVRERTRRIFYVCCSRAKENLIVFYQNPSPKTLQKASEWFGRENVCQI